jgi:hypothetical protein
VQGVVFTLEGKVKQAALLILPSSEVEPTSDET